MGPVQHADGLKAFFGARQAFPATYAAIDQR